MTNQIIDITSIFTSENFYESEKLRIEKLAEKAKIALDTPITDKETYKINHETQMELRDERIKWEKARKEFTASLDEKKKFAIDRERSITSHIIPIEETIKSKKEEYDKEQERIKAEKEAEEMRVFQARYDELMKYGVTTDLASLKAMTDDGFRMMADMYKKKWEEAEKVRIEQEAENQRLTQEAEAKRQAELEEARKLKEENDRKAQEIADREKAIQDKENEIKRQEELKATAEKARIDAIAEEKARAERERIHKEETEKAESARIEKEDKYKDWLANNGVTIGNRDDFKIEKDENEVILWKKVSVYKI
jgi:hypothetical protein